MMRKNTLRLTLMIAPCAILFIGGVSRAEETSAALTLKAWATLGAHKHAEAVATTEKCISQYRKTAREMQKAIAAPLAADNKAAIEKNHALNDVGTCYWILGQALEKLGDQERALKSYQHLVDQFSGAHCWDTNGWFWKPAVAARERIAAMRAAAKIDATRKIDWVLVWSDEFDTGKVPDAGKWRYEVGFIRNHEAQYYTHNRSENARVENGHLVVEARKEHFPLTALSPNGQGRKTAEITSACLTTETTMHLTYGRIEVRAKLPEGRGLWPAIWTLGTNFKTAGWPDCGEIDIMEFVGYEPGVTHSYLHTKGYNHIKGNPRGNTVNTVDASQTFHVYAVDWTREFIRFYVDDRCHYTVINDGTGNDAWPFDQPQYLLLNLAVGGSWGGRKGIDASMFPQQFLVDYVRVYREKK